LQQTGIAVLEGARYRNNGLYSSCVNTFYQIKKMRKMKNLLLLLVCFLSAQLLPAAAVVPGADAASGCRVNPPNAEITILFAYTTSAAIAAGGPKNIKRDVDYGMGLLNTALANNQIPLTVRAITQYVQVDYAAASTDAAVTDLLTELRKTNGKFNKVHQFRQQTRADIVCLVFSGYTMGKADLNGAFMVCHYAAFGDSYVFPHEFGHVLGATHEAGMNFNFGENAYRTIANNGGVSIPYFSQPRTITMSLAGASRTFTIGDASHNNAGTITTNSTAKSALGEALTVVPNATGAVPAILVDPMTAPTPTGGAAPYNITSFTVSAAGMINVKYTCTDAVTFKVEGYDAGSTTAFGVFSSTLDPSKTSMDLPGWGNTYPGDRYELKINNVVIKTFTAP